MLMFMDRPPKTLVYRYYTRGGRKSKSQIYASFSREARRAGRPRRPEAGSLCERELSSVCETEGSDPTLPVSLRSTTSPSQGEAMFRPLRYNSLNSCLTYRAEDVIFC